MTCRKNRRKNRWNFVVVVFFQMYETFFLLFFLPSTPTVPRIHAGSFLSETLLYSWVTQLRHKRWIMTTKGRCTPLWLTFSGCIFFLICMGYLHMYITVLSSKRLYAICPWVKHCFPSLGEQDESTYILPFSSMSPPHCIGKTRTKSRSQRTEFRGVFLFRMCVPPASFFFLHRRPHLFSPWWCNCAVLM